ncbi:MAG TPA: phage tail protein [Clostridia bacterium]|nr:phage tail protein [Clostridia bacterium]
MSVNVIVDTKQVKQIAIELQKFPGQIPKATAQAMNRTIDHIYTQTSREVRKDYAIKDKDIKSTLRKIKATAGRLGGGVVSTGRTLTLYQHFKVSPANPAKGKRYQVKVTVKKGRSELIKTDPKPFISTVTGKKQVMKREGRSHLPVTILRSLSVPQMISNEKVMSSIQESGSKMLEKRIEHEISRRLKKVGAK